MGTVAITGSASGIGAAVRERLEAGGDRVIGVDLRGAEIEADLSTRAGRDAALAGIRAAAPSGLDRLILSAGLGPHLDDFPLIASVNYFGAVHLLDGLLADLAGRPGAAAVAVCSNSAQFGDFQEHPFILALLDDDEPKAREIIAAENGYLAYGGSKHALCRALRRRTEAWGAAGVRINGICPGPTTTPLLQSSLEHPVFGQAVESLQIPLGRRADPEEMAGVIAFLLGPEAAYIHGSVLYVDGGCDAAVRPDRF
jgi:NAD(P)-dependent dehydrogenase (short-subunit alcohol dehydrogenase family)